VQPASWRRKGLQGTSFSDVLELTGAPRGSIYHHFPDWKEQLIGEAVDFAGARAIALLNHKAGSSPTEITEFFLYLWKQVLVRSNFQAGCSVFAVTVTTDSPTLLEHAARVFRDWRASLTELFKTGGVAAIDAERFSATLIASTKGALAFSRAEQNIEPLDAVSEQLLSQVSALQKGRS
jgi:TetR/AcrR family transcriptional repressor of lmrAB and yxaGH operons